MHTSRDTLIKTHVKAYKHYSTTHATQHSHTHTYIHFTHAHVHTAYWPYGCRRSNKPACTRSATRRTTARASGSATGSLFSAMGGALPAPRPKFDLASTIWRLICSRCVVLLCACVPTHWWAWILRFARYEGWHVSVALFCFARV